MKYFEAKAIIRYALSDLRVRNAHHEFEELSLEVARRRVASNVAPNTGPVGAGGDQGRDFESYRTFLAGELGSKSSFAAQVSDGLVVGACTLQQDPLAKIKSDLATIFSGGEKPVHVAYFCEANIATAKQHELQEHCKAQYNATLDIFDGTKLADLLVESDLVWIAEKFLRLPADSIPAPDFGEHYEELRKKWLLDVTPPETFADFIEIKQGLRTATRSDEATGDLAGWIALMKQFADHSERALALRACYELCVAELRGNGHLDPALAYFRRYLNALSDESTLSELDDGAVLLMYGSGAIRHHATSLTTDDLRAAFLRVETLIQSRLQRAQTRAERASLLEALAVLAPIPRPNDDENGDAENARILDAWAKVVEASKDLPLFPVVRLGEMLDLLAPIFGVTREA